MESKLKTKKFEVIRRLIYRYKNFLKIIILCKIAGVFKSGYYHFLHQESITEEKHNKDKASFKLILLAYCFKNRHKDARKIKMTLQNFFNTTMNLKKIRRLMTKFNLICPIRKATPYRRMAENMANQFSSQKSFK